MRAATTGAWSRLAWRVLLNTIQRRSIASGRQHSAPRLVDPQLYRSRHVFQERLNIKVLDVFSAAFDRDDGQQQYLDVGSATGDFTRDVLLPRCEPCRRIVGVDITEDMVNYARLHSPHPKITYEVLDISSDVECLLAKYGVFKRVYSFYTLHWLKDQLPALKNVARLMAADGECLLLFCGKTFIWEAWREVTKLQRWSDYAEEVEKKIPSTQDVEDLRSYLKALLQAAGLDPHTCEVFGDRWEVPSEEALKEAVLPLLPIPNGIGKQDEEDLRNEYVTQVCNISRSRYADFVVEATMCLLHASKGS